MSHNRCEKSTEKFVGYDDEGNKIYEVTRHFKELPSETYRYTVPKKSEENLQNDVGEKTATNKKPKIKIIERQLMAGVTTQKRKCPPHVVYYAYLIMRWRCSYCGGLWHKQPKNSYLDSEVEKIVVKK